MNPSSDIQLLPAQPDDARRLAELRAEALFDSLSRLGRYNEQRVRERFYGSYDPQYTKIVEVGGRFTGCVALKPDAQGEGWLLEHFYLSRDSRGHGVGAEVLRRMLLLAAEDPRPVRLNVLQGSAARRLYARFGFETESEDGIDVYMVLHPLLLPTA
ncbi:hypothetical protein B9G55_08430 [Saccharibacillus sp. O16]|nr:hypothetical protein B9G55_08430 [Saccharibacillus sp. O16]